MKIGSKKIGNEYPVYIILEIARTHKDLKEAEQMVKIAATAGADAIKIQSIRADNLMVTNKETKNYVEMLKEFERDFDYHKALADMAKDHGLEFLSTPESTEMVDLLEKVGVLAYKVSSLDFVYYDLLKYIAKKGKPMFLSTGMATAKEITKTVDFLNQYNRKFILMHCSSLYPTKPENAHLKNILMLQKFEKIIGYSDHTIGITAPIAAVVLGAKVIEKHFTLDTKQKGIDHGIAVDPALLGQMVREIRKSEQMLGSCERILSNEEKEIRKTKRRKIFVNELYAGEVITKEKIKLLQNKSKDGIDGVEIDKVLGKIPKCYVEDLLKWEHLM